MPNIPRTIVNKGAQRVQGVFIVIGGFFGIAAFGGFSAGDIGGGFTCAAICGASWFIASKIKTKKTLVGGTATYR